MTSLFCFAAEKGSQGFISLENLNLYIVSRNTERNGVRWKGEGRNEEGEKSKYVLHLLL